MPRERAAEGKGFLFIFFPLVSSFFFARASVLISAKRIRYESNGVARNGLTRYIVVSRFASRTPGCSRAAWPNGQALIDSGVEAFAEAIFDNLRVINSDCGARGDTREAAGGETAESV